MKRDMDLARRILLATEALEADGQLNGLPDVEEEAFVQHVIWLKEAGLVKAVTSDNDMGTYAIALRLTWIGCDFLDAARSDTLWTKAKTAVLKPGMSFTFDLLKEWLKAEISQGLPTLRTLGKQLT